MLKRILAVTTVFVLLFALVGCKPEAVDPDNGGDEGTGDEIEGTIMMITDLGGVNDKSFNQSAWEGLESMKEKYPNVNFDYIASSSETEYAANLITAVDSGSELTWAVGFMLADAIAEAAESMPDTQFGLIDVPDPEVVYDNVVYVGFKEQEGSFLAGALAAMTTESNKVGFIGGMDSEAIKRFEVGYRAGVEYVNPEVEVTITYAESWSDTQKGKAIAGTMYDQGVDIIYHAAGNVGNGVFEAAKERGTGPEGFWTIGVDRDQLEEAPDNMLTSMMKKVGAAMALITDEYLTTGEPQGGEIHILGLAEDSVGLAPTTDQTVPEDIREEALAKIEEYKEMIISGDLVIPGTVDALVEFIASLEK